MYAYEVYFFVIYAGITLNIPKFSDSEKCLFGSRMPVFAGLHKCTHEHFLFTESQLMQFMWTENKWNSTDVLGSL